MATRALRKRECGRKRVSESVLVRESEKERVWKEESGRKGE